MKVLEPRFTNHKGLCKDFECFYSSSFVLLPNLPNSSLQKDCAKLIKFYPELTQDNLLMKLLEFASMKNSKLLVDLLQKCTKEEVAEAKNQIIDSHKFYKKFVVRCYNIL